MFFRLKRFVVFLKIKNKTVKEKARTSVADEPRARNSNSRALFASAQTAKSFNLSAKTNANGRVYGHKNAKEHVTFYETVETKQCVLLTPVLRT